MTELLRDSTGHALSFATPEQALKAVEQFLRRSPGAEVVIGWVPMPRRPWRVYLLRRSVT